MDNNLETKTEMSREEILSQIASVKSRLEEGSALVLEIREKIELVKNGLESGEISDQQAGIMIENIKVALGEVDGSYQKILKGLGDLKSVA